MQMSDFNPLIFYVYNSFNLQQKFNEHAKTLKSGEKSKTSSA